MAISHNKLTPRVSRSRVSNASFLLLLAFSTTTFADTPPKLDIQLDAAFQPPLPSAAQQLYSKNSRLTPQRRLPPPGLTAWSKAVASQVVPLKPTENVPPISDEDRKILLIAR
jgi:hypothetical protein